MNQETILPIKPTLDDVRKKFESWRRSRKKRSRIPKKLWEAAVKLSSDYTISQISKSLHLNYVQLEKCIISAKENKSLPTQAAPSFIEIDLGKSMESAECVVEIEKRDGSKMKMYFRGKVDLNLLEFGKAFLE
jgi:hypothetical protein